jgi:hypothetical protein
MRRPPARLLMLLACASVASAQPAAPPKVLLLVRQQFKIGRAHARERLERAKAAIYNRLEVPNYWMEMQAFTGPSEALFFDPFDSIEDVEKAEAALGPLDEAHPELARMSAGIDDTLSSQRTILAVRLDSTGGTQVNTAINLAQARFLRMLVVRTRPGQGPPILDSAALPAVLYQVSSGMPGPAYLIFQPMADFNGIPPIHISIGTIAEDSVYAIEPDLSHISRAFAEQDQSFWMKP